ncbi:acyl-coenzyme A oxidase 1 [Drosophila tropicalis]|uniref:acyl-coenzyme A oxidase 1 n=1 Tax=Drosophila tropicalis TaxID=46794 RepID=UPI0035AC21DC
MMNVDLQQERASATIDSEDFAQWWAGGKTNLEQRRTLESQFFNDPQFDDVIPPSCLSYKERYEHSVARGTRFLHKLRQWFGEKQGKNNVCDLNTLQEFRFLLSGPLGTGLFQQSFPLRLHFSMFVSTLLNQGTEEQQRKWLSRAWHMDGIIGTYAQTELGHGSYIRGLETRADYDAEHEEFILNTPNLTAYKWWPGGLGQTANMVVVLAQLYVGEIHCGLQSFLVRIRDEQTHEPIFGVDVGDIGPKLGANCVNNGYLGFQNVRIPRDQMLMKNAQVTSDGKFIQSGQPLLLYGTMVFVRVITVRDVMFELLQAGTIATRYSAVRRQSPIEPGKPEPQILDHLTQQAKIFPQLSRGVSYRLVADWLWQFYRNVMQTLEKNASAPASDSLAELHAVSCCLKAVATQEASEGIDILRKACGGHGYMASANFDSIYGLATAAYTYEGEYTVLLLQTSRFLLRQYVDSLKRKVLPASVTYLRDVSRLVWGKDLVENCVRSLEIASLEQIRLAWHCRNEQRKRGLGEEQANNLAGRQLVAAATAHAHAFITRTTVRELRRIVSGLKPSVAGILSQLMEIFVLDTFLRQAGQVLRWNSINGRQLRQVEQRFEQLLSGLRPNAVALVDGFDFHDRVLGSTLGAYDGRVYERLMAEARRNPLNQESVNSSFYSHLQPMMRGKL